MSSSFSKIAGGTPAADAVEVLEEENVVSSQSVGIVLANADPKRADGMSKAIVAKAFGLSICFAGDDSSSMLYGGGSPELGLTNAAQGLVNAWGEMLRGMQQDIVEKGQVVCEGRWLNGGPIWEGALPPSEVPVLELDGFVGNDPAVKEALAKRRRVQYRPDGGTPLNRFIVEALSTQLLTTGLLMAGEKDGYAALVIQSDGDADYDPANFELACQLIRDARASKRVIVAGIAVGEAAGRYFRSLGLDDKWIAEGNDSASLIKSLRELAWTLSSAAQGPSSSKAAVDGGLGSGAGAMTSIAQ